jgi:hypothetical protein
VSLQDPSGLFFGVNPEATPYASRLARAENSGGWPLILRELNLARAIKANLLVVGSERFVARLVDLLATQANLEAVVQCQRHQLNLLPASPPLGAVVLRDVDGLNQEEQRRLLQWLDSARYGRQIVSTASERLLPFVNAGTFSDALYYRLNTVYIDLTAEESRQRVY